MTSGQQASANQAGQSIRVTVGQNGVPDAWGFISASFGSVSPTSWRSRNWASVYSDTSGLTRFRLGFGSGVTWPFSSIGIQSAAGIVTLLRSAASNALPSDFVWSGSNIWTASDLGQVRLVTINP